MVNSTEEDLDIQGFSATHPVARFFLQESTEQEYRKANFRAWGKSIRIPLIIVIIGEVLWIADYLSAIGILGTPTDPSAPTDYGQVAGWCLPALLCVGFLLFTFTRFFTWRSYKPFVPVVVIFAMLFHVLPVLAISPAVEHGDGFCGGEKQAQLVAEQGAWYVSKSLFYVLCIGFYSTCLPISLFLFFVCNGLYFVKTAMQWEQVCPANEKGKGRPVRGVGGGVAVPDHSPADSRVACATGVVHGPGRARAQRGAHRLRRLHPARRGRPRKAAAVRAQRAAAPPDGRAARAAHSRAGRREAQGPRAADGDDLPRGAQPAQRHDGPPAARAPSARAGRRPERARRAPPRRGHGQGVPAARERRRRRGRRRSRRGRRRAGGGGAGGGGRVARVHGGGAAVPERALEPSPHRHRRHERAADAMRPERGARARRDGGAAAAAAGRRAPPRDPERPAAGGDGRHHAHADPD